MPLGPLRPDLPALIKEFGGTAVELPGYVWAGLGGIVVLRLLLRHCQDVLDRVLTHLEIMKALDKDDSWIADLIRALRNRRGHKDRLSTGSPPGGGRQSEPDEVAPTDNDAPDQTKRDSGPFKIVQRIRDLF